jgi:hypothetical protein
MYRVKAGSVNTMNDFNQIKLSVMEKGPIPTGFFVFADFFLGTLPSSKGGDGWKATGGIYVHLQTDESGKTPNGDTIPYNYPGGAAAMNAQVGGHAVAIVGWGVDEVPNFLKKSFPNQDTIKLPYWIVRNSWGTTWNGDGYFKIAQTDAKNYINTAVKLDDSTGGLGGVVDFDPDLSNAPPPLHPRGKSGKGGSGSILKKLIGFIIVIAGLVALFYIGKYLWNWYQTKKAMGPSIGSNSSNQVEGRRSKRGSLVIPVDPELNISTIQDGEEAIKTDERILETNVRSLNSRVQNLKSRSRQLSSRIQHSDSELQSLEAKLGQLESIV